jgi:uncharacterized protein involved in exopolysaccharide biosynthesis
MATQQGQAFEDLRNTVSECSRIVRHRWRLSTVGLSLVGAVAFWCSQYLPREYSANTLFERRDDMVLQNLVHANSPYSFDHLKTTMSLDMTGSRAMARAIVAVGLLPADTFTSESALSERERGALEATIRKFKLTAGVNLIHSTASLDTIELRCSANDPAIARQFVIALRDSYIAETRERIRGILSGTRAFFEGEIRRLQDQVAVTDVDLRKGLEEYPGLDPTDLVGLGNRLELLRTQRENLLQRKTGLEADVTAREQFLSAAAPPTTFAAEEPNAPAMTASVPDETVEHAMETVQRELLDLVTNRRMTFDHPEVKARYAQLEALKNLRSGLAELLPATRVALPVAKTPPVTEGFREWQAQRMRVELELTSLRRQLDAANAQLAEADGRLDRVQRLFDELANQDEGLRQRMAKRNESASEVAVWQGHLAGLERVLAAESGERGTQFTLLEEPEDVVRPSKPRVASVFVVCSGLGLAAATLLVALAELFDRSFRSVGQVTRILGIPVLECIGTMPTPRERRRDAVRRLIWTPTLALLVLALAASAALAYTSLMMPTVHAEALQRMNRALGAVGMTWLSPALPPGT